MKMGLAKKSVLIVGGAALTWLTAGPVQAQQAAPAEGLLGAQKALEKIAQELAAQKSKGPNPAIKVREGFENDVKCFKETRAALPPEKAATEWLALFDRFWTLPAGPDATSDSTPGLGRIGQNHALSVLNVIAVLPAPPAWEALAAQVEKRSAVATGKNERLRETALRLLADRLTGAADKFKRDAESMKALVAELDPGLSELTRTFQETYNEWNRQFTTPATIVREFEKEIEEQKVAAQQDQSFRLEIPDLVPLAGEKRAAELIIAALEIPGVCIEMPNADKSTLALARRLCLERMDKLKFPQWQLADSPDAIELYEAFSRKFPDTKTDDSEVGSRLKASTTSSHVLSLLARNRVQDAVTIVSSVKDEELDTWKEHVCSWEWERMQDVVPAAVYFDFCGRLLKTKPYDFLWHPYIELALQLDRTDEMLRLLSAQAAATNLTINERFEAQKRLADGCLAADRAADAARELRKILQLDVTQEIRTVQLAFEDKRASVAIRLANLGRLLKQPEWTAEGIQAAETALARMQVLADTNSPDEQTRTRGEILELLVQEHQYTKAEAFQLETISRKMRPQLSYINPNSTSMTTAPDELIQLADIYYQAGRYGEILTLMENAPWWGTDDLANLQSEQCDGGSVAFSVMAAEGLSTAGRTAEAVEILKHYLYRNPGDDDAYKLLVRLAPAGLMSWLDSLYQRDRFEERPLIWKAVLLMQENKLGEAEKVAREALRVDPTDGETKAGDRVRGYAVLGDILAAQGRKEDADFFRKVVESVRIAEQGDELTNTGLVKRSIALYEKAQSYFADAYCVQWRLARRLDAIGQTAEAEKHYRIAFERMPEQFGQVANFCFGCEGAFASGHSRSAAETVLLRLEKNGPKRPQVYYLLGQLREAQERHAEAYAYYRKAIEMDPRYLDAWKQIQEIADKLYLPRTERDDIALHMLRMDPLQRHMRGYASKDDINEISDLKTLWSVLQEARPLNIKPAGHPLRFTATAAILKEKSDRQDKNQPDLSSNGGSLSSPTDEPDQMKDPGEVIATNHVIEQIAELMKYSATADKPAAVK